MKYILLAATAALILISCSEDDAPLATHIPASNEPYLPADPAQAVAYVTADVGVFERQLVRDKVRIPFAVFSQLSGTAGAAHGGAIYAGQLIANGRPGEAREKALEVARLLRDGRRTLSTLPAIGSVEQ